MASKIAEELVEQGFIELPAEFFVDDQIFEAMDNELTIEEHLNEEVRTMLNEYGNQMRESGASYQETFKLIKRKLVRERKIVL